MKTHPFLQQIWSLVFQFPGSLIIQQEAGNFRGMSKRRRDLASLEMERKYL
jgi:hypothetical protein